jgi:hypothetical protein
MLCGQVFERFVAKCPVTVMVRGLMERAFRPESLDRLFLDTAQRQYTRDLLFSTTVDLLATVVCRIHPSVHAAYKDNEEGVGVAVRSLYDKLAATETALSEALVRHTAEQLGPILPRLQATLPPYVPGYKTKILDGNHLAATQRRLKGLRDVAAGALPGQTLVVLEPERQLATDAFCCEDAHAQERSLLPRLLDRVAAKDLWIADRNFCTTAFLFWRRGRPASSSVSTARRCPGSGKAPAGAWGGSTPGWSTSSGCGSRTTGAASWRSAG